MTDELYIPSTGLIPDTPDDRDFKYSDILGANTDKVDWEKGYNVYEELGLKHILQDQGASYSCVGQGTAQYLRVWHRHLTGEDVDFSRRFIYSQISLGYGQGAMLRDGVKLVSTLGDCKESSLPSYELGVAPTERFILSKEGITSEILAEAIPFDRFNYRVIPGNTSDINLFASAIRNHWGVLGGFTGTNQGWTVPLIQPPQPEQTKWGHCVYLCGYGMYQGRKCVFTPGSWGGRYTITEGRWKGLQAIPEEYFKASVTSAVGEVEGAYVFNSWVLLPDEELEPNQKIMDILQKNEGRLVQDVQGTGAFGLVKGGKILVADKDRAAELCLTYLVKKEGVPFSKDVWDSAQKEQF